MNFACRVLSGLKPLSIGLWFYTRSNTSAPLLNSTYIAVNLLIEVWEYEYIGITRMALYTVVWETWQLSTGVQEMEKRETLETRKLWFFLWHLCFYCSVGIVFYVSWTNTRHSTSTSLTWFVFKQVYYECQSSNSARHKPVEGLSIRQSTLKSLSQMLSESGNRFNNQGPVARSLVSANRWLRGIKTYRFPSYLTLVSANHASSNRASSLDSESVGRVGRLLVSHSQSLIPAIYRLFGRGIDRSIDKSLFVGQLSLAHWVKR